MHETEGLVHTIGETMTLADDGSGWRLAGRAGRRADVGQGRWRVYVNMGARRRDERNVQRHDWGRNSAVRYWWMEGRRHASMVQTRRRTFLPPGMAQAGADGDRWRRARRSGRRSNGLPRKRSPLASRSPVSTRLARRGAVRASRVVSGEMCRASRMAQGWDQTLAETRGGDSITRAPRSWRFALARSSNVCTVSTKQAVKDGNTEAGGEH